MFLKLLFTILLCGFAVAIADTDLGAIMTQHKESLQILRSVRNIRSMDDQLQDVCYDWYFNALNYNMDTYRQGMQQCQVNFDDAKQSLNSAGAYTRASFEYRGDNICWNLQSCHEKADLLDFLFCYKNGSITNIPEIYTLSADTSAEYEILSIKYENNSANRKGCEEKVSDYYLSCSKETDESFYACYAGYGVPDWPKTTSTINYTTDITYTSPIPPQ